jgi:pilus assembly protein Flp/PilA
MRRHLANFLRDERGATAIEYGLLTALVAAVMITGLRELGSNLNSQMIAIGTKLN